MNTPRTDAAVYLTIAPGHNSVDPNFARKLEIELKTAHETNMALAVQLVDAEANVKSLTRRLAKANHAAKKHHEGNRAACARENKLRDALQKACDHLDYCGYGDAWEREGTGPLRQQIYDALAKPDRLKV